MSKKRLRAKSVSARRLFVASIDRLVSNYKNNPHIDDIDETFSEKHSELLQRMRSDDRMQVVWEALAEISDEGTYDGFLDELQATRGTLAAVRFFVPTRKRRLQELRDMTDMARRLQRFYEDKDRAAWSLLVPGLAEQLRTARTLLVKARRWDADRLRKEQRWSSRKSAGGRVEFIVEAARLIKAWRGKPSYEVVAALANVVFDTGDDDSVTPDNVRKIVKRKPDYWTR
jgi:hypothetical protein